MPSLAALPSDTQAPARTRDAANLALLLESTGEGIYGIDREGRCTFVNRAAAQMLGYGTDAVLQQNMHRLIHHTHADHRAYPEHDCPILNAYRRGQLSGGMKQRAGIARAFAIEPQMLLLDEPCGALDALTRGTIQDELLRICSQTRQTVFMITHDVDEAILLADTVLLMSNGPQARIAEVVRNPLPRSRQRATLHHEPLFYAVRNHLVDFLVSRSKDLSHGRAPEQPPEIWPGVGPETLSPPPVSRAVLQRVV